LHPRLNTQPIIPEPNLQDKDNVSTQSDQSDDPLLFQPHGHICALIATSGNIDPIPKCYREARQFGEWKHWELAVNEELAKMVSYHVWEVIDHAAGHRAVDGNCVSPNMIDGATGKPCKTKQGGLQKVSSRLKELTTTSYLQLLRTRTLSDYTLPMPIITTWNATWWTSRLLPLMMT
jgi:hypothetical protein